MKATLTLLYSIVAYSLQAQDLEIQLRDSSLIVTSVQAISADKLFTKGKTIPFKDIAKIKILSGDLSENAISSLSSSGVIIFEEGNKVSLPGSVDMPLDPDTKSIVYTEVVNVDSASSEELFSRGQEWFALSYKSSNDVLQLKDKESGKIIGKAAVALNYPYMGTMYNGGHIHYTISIYVKEGRYKYIVDNLYHTGYGNQVDNFGRCEDMLIRDYKVWGFSYKKRITRWLNQADESIRNSISSLKAFMAKRTFRNSKNDW